MSDFLSPANHDALYGDIIERFTAWAAGEPGIAAAMIIGSRARADHPADAWSDLDIVTFADDPAALLADTGWLEQLGEPAITFVHATPVGGWSERRVLLGNGCDVDIPVLPAALLQQMLAAAPDDPVQQVFAPVVGRGYRVLVDRSGKLDGALARLTIPQPASVTAELVGQTLSDFWYHCVWTAKKLRRGEIYTAHDCLDGYLRYLLMRLVRWGAEGGGGTWHSMRFLEEWAPREVVEILPLTWARHDPDDIARALEQMMEAVSRLARRIDGDGDFGITDGEEVVARTMVHGLLRG